MAQHKKGDVKPFLYNEIFASQHPHWQYEAVFRMFGFGDNVYLSEVQQHVRQINKIVDLWHIHNTPDFFVPVVAEQTKKPVIWDVHDLRSFQHQDDKFRTQEDAAANTCTHIFTVSPEYVDLLKSRYPTKPVTYYRSMVPKEWCPKPSQAETSGIVYQGGLSSRPGHYRNIFPWIAESEIPFHVYPAANVPAGEYEVPLNCEVHQSAQLFDLFRSIAKFEAGFVGTYGKHKAFEGALPNKLFEYIACGIPVIAANVPAVADFLKDNPDLGIVCDDPKEAKEALKKIKKDNMRKKVVEQRDRFTIDIQNKKYVEPVYKSLL